MDNAVHTDARLLWRRFDDMAVNTRSDMCVKTHSPLAASGVYADASRNQPPGAERRLRQPYRRLATAFRHGYPRLLKFDPLVAPPKISTGGGE